MGGDFLLVGLHQDELIHHKKGKNYPIQTLRERALNVLSCKYVDDVLLGAPWKVTLDLLKSLNVSVVVTGMINVYADGAKDPQGLGDPFDEVRGTHKLQFLESELCLTMDT